jgi:phosphatidylglycerophosphate synthase
VFDGPLRRWYAPALEGTGRKLHQVGISAGAVTLAAFVAGIGAAGAVVVGQPAIALVLWLLNRLLDGLDGVLARASGTSSDLGGYLDFLADVVVYASLTASLAFIHPEARVAFLVLLAVISVNYTAHLSLATLLEKRASAGGRDKRTLLLVPGIAEGFESIIAFTLLIAIPSWAGLVAWIFATLIAASILQRVIIATRVLGGARA